jgi:hypothetical protein
MGRDRNDFISVIPDDLQLFDQTDIRKAFEHLEKTFHLHHDWHNQFRQELLEVQRGISEQEYFFRYALKNIDPALKAILRRKESVIFSLCRYLISDKIKAKKQEENHLLNFYRNGHWKK